MFLDMVPPELQKSSPSEPRFSFYKATHRRALKNLVDWVLSLNFLPALTLLVKVRGPVLRNIRCPSIFIQTHAAGEGAG